MVIKETKIVLLAWVLWLPHQVMSTETYGYVVIVNSNNPINQITKAHVQQLYLKSTNTWPDSHLKALPIDLPISNVLRRRFTAQILDKKMEQISAYWDKATAKGMKKTQGTQGR